MKKITPIIFALITMLGSCNMSDYDEDLSGGYFYMDEAPDNRTIGVAPPGKKDIGSTVEAYAYDDNYILVIQRPLLDYYRSAIGNDLVDCLYSKTPEEDAERGKIMADSVIKHDPYYQKVFSRPINYWIISHQVDSIFGPFSKEEYFQKRKELGVPKELKPREVY